jgi:two-component system LytT family sensor kinase
MVPFKKMEFGVATGVFLLLIFFLLFRSVTYNVFELQHTYGDSFRKYHQVFDYYIHYLLPLLAHITVVYGAFLFLNMLVVPRFLERERWLPGIALTLLTLAVAFLVIMVAYSYYYGYLLAVYDTIKGAHMFFAKRAFIITALYATIYVLYYAGRYIYFQYFRSGKVRVPGLTVLACVWLLLLVFTLSTNSSMLFLVLLLWVPRYVVVFFLYQKQVFPRYQNSHQNKWILYRDIALISVGTGMLLVLPFIGAMGFKVLFCLVALETVFLMISWWVYTSQLSKTAVQDLQKALGRSTADLDMLRAQINPHFLFNALNTLYGTALQESASNTSEGIQRLGDMMRFMLHENHQEKIPLSKEVAYLHNYISLQRLRTQSSPDIQITVNIDESRCDHDIAPMLLVPFVENAFKHGISLRSKSAINISLCCDDKKIYFDVYNSIHERPEQAVGREGNGIGLNNVQQRLALIYPRRHELNIRKTAAGFFIHLTIDVSRS